MSYPDILVQVDDGPTSQPRVAGAAALAARWGAGLTGVFLKSEFLLNYMAADSLSYLSIKGVLEGLDLPYDRFCFACFDGRYPVPVPYDTTRHKFVLEDAEPGGLGLGEPVSRGESEGIVKASSHE